MFLDDLFDDLTSSSFSRTSSTVMRVHAITGFPTMISGSDRRRSLCIMHTSFCDWGAADIFVLYVERFN